MTNTPDEATLIAIKHSMNMLLALLPVNGKTEFDMGDASIMASVPSFVVMASAGAVPKALDYTLPRVPIAISDADISRIADAVLHVSISELGTRVADENDVAIKELNAQYSAKQWDRMREAAGFAGQGAYNRQHRNMPVSFDADGQPVTDKGGLE